MIRSIPCMARYASHMIRSAYWDDEHGGRYMYSPTHCMIRSAYIHTHTCSSYFDNQEVTVDRVGEGKYFTKLEFLLTFFEQK